MIKSFLTYISFIIFLIFLTIVSYDQDKTQLDNYGVCSYFELKCGDCHKNLKDTSDHCEYCKSKNVIIYNDHYCTTCKKHVFNSGYCNDCNSKLGYSKSLDSINESIEKLSSIKNLVNKWLFCLGCAITFGMIYIVTFIVDIIRLHINKVVVHKPQI